MKIFVIKRTVMRSFDDDKLDEVLSKRDLFGNLAFDLLKDAQSYLLNIGASPVVFIDESNSHYKEVLYTGSSSIVVYYEIVEVNRILSFD